MSKAVGVPKGSPFISLNTAGTDLLKTTQELSTRTTQLLSKQNFTL